MTSRRSASWISTRHRPAGRRLVRGRAGTDQPGRAKGSLPAPAALSTRQRTVYIPAGQEHWHGPTAGNFMCHLAMLEGIPGGDGTTWLEPVTDEQYQAANEQ
jgi:hypothetical protein